MNRPERLYSAIVTLLALGLLTTVLVVGRLTYPPEEKSPWDVDKTEILLADEYIAVEDMILPPERGYDEPAKGEPVTGEEAAPGQASSTDLEDAGEQGAAQPVLTAPDPQPVKVQEQKKPEKPATPRKNDKEKQQQAKAKNINTSVNNAFTKFEDNSAGNNTSAKPNPSGGNTKKVTSGVTPGFKMGNGWSVASFGAVGAQNKPLGTVIIDVVVDAQGNVIAASPAGGTPPAASNAAVVAECIRAAKQSRFKRSLTTAAPEKSRGQIFWTFAEQSN